MADEHPGALQKRRFAEQEWSVSTLVFTGLSLNIEGGGV